MHGVFGGSNSRIQVERILDFPASQQRRGEILRTTKYHIILVFAVSIGYSHKLKGMPS